MVMKCSGYMDDSNCPFYDEFKIRKTSGLPQYLYECPENCPVLAGIAAPGGDYAVMKPYELHGPIEKYFCKGTSQFCGEKGSNPECVHEWMDGLSESARCKAIGCKFHTTLVPCPPACRASEI